MESKQQSTRKPDFLIIGAQKCGTSWLFQNLRAHPQVFLPEQKESEFFSYLPNLDKPGLPHYLQPFRAARADQLVGDACSSYFWTPTKSPWSLFPEGFNPDIAASVRTALGPDLKLMVCVRDPVERALSAYAHYVAFGELPVDQPLSESLGYIGIIDMGFYARHLEHWLRHYPLEQIHMVVLEQGLVNDGQQTLMMAGQFLGLEGTPAPQKVDAPVFRGTRRILDNEGNLRFEAPAHHTQRLIPAKGVSRQQLQWLKDIYRDDVHALETLTGRELAGTWGY